MNDRNHTAFTEGENATQFIYFHPTVSTNNVIDSLNVAGVTAVAGLPLRISSAKLVCPSASLQRRNHSLTVLTSTDASPYAFCSHLLMRMGILFSAVKNSITERCLIRTSMSAILQWDAVLSSAVVGSYYCSGLDKKVF